MNFVFKKITGLERNNAGGYDAVSAAMTLGNRAVWDVRPLPDHFIEYAADDVRNILTMSKHLLGDENNKNNVISTPHMQDITDASPFVTAAPSSVSSLPATQHSGVSSASTVGGGGIVQVPPLPSILEVSDNSVNYLDAVERLTKQYVDHYAVGKPVEVEADPQPHVVFVEWLERYLGPGGGCTFCGARGHVEVECFRKKEGRVKRCGYCGDLGHVTGTCFKKHPELLRCTHCGQMGHNAAHCFRLHPCKHCGGTDHTTEKCRNKPSTATRDEANAAPEVQPKKAAVSGGKLQATASQVAPSDDEL